MEGSTVYTPLVDAIGAAVLYPLVTAGLLSQPPNPNLHIPLGVACTSVQDLMGLNTMKTPPGTVIKTLEDLVALGKEANYDCKIFIDVTVRNLGPVLGVRDIRLPSGRMSRINEITVEEEGVTKHYFLFANLP